MTTLSRGTREVAQWYRIMALSPVSDRGCFARSLYDYWVNNFTQPSDINQLSQKKKRLCSFRKPVIIFVVFVVVIAILISVNN